MIIRGKTVVVAGTFEVTVEARDRHQKKRVEDALTVAKAMAS